MSKLLNLFMFVVAIYATICTSFFTIRSIEQADAFMFVMFGGLVGASIFLMIITFNALKKSKS